MSSKVKDIISKSNYEITYVEVSAKSGHIKMLTIFADSLIIGQSLNEMMDLNVRDGYIKKYQNWSTRFEQLSANLWINQQYLPPLRK